MSRLENLMRYYAANRQVGHTTMMLQGITIDREQIVIVDSARTARLLIRQLEIPPVYINIVGLQIGKTLFKTTQWLDKEYLRFNCPVVIDHFALQILVEEHTKEIYEQANKSN